MSLYTLAFFLHVSGAIMASMLLGIVFLMTTKPQLVPSLVAMVVSVVVGLIVSLPFWSSTRRHASFGSAHMNDGEADPFLRTTMWTRRW